MLKTSLNRNVWIVLIGLLIFSSSSGGQTRVLADANQPSDACMIYMPMVAQVSTMPQAWQLYYNLEEHYRFVVPEGWDIQELHGASSPSKEHIMADNIPTDRTGIPLSFDDPAWPPYLFQVEFITNETPLDPHLSFEENVRKIVASGVTTVTGFSEDPAYLDGMFIGVGRQNAPAVQGKVFSRVYSSGNSQYLMIITVAPKNRWDDPTIQFILNSLDFQN